MNNKGMNSTAVKESNRAAVLRVLSQYGKMSRKDIAEKLGLTAATVTIICTELLDNGVIRELGEASDEERRAGRKKILIDIDYEYKNVLCIAIETETTYVALSNLAGEVITKKSIPTAENIESEVFLRSVAKACRTVMMDSKGKAGILGAGVTIPGMHDRFIIKSFFESELGIPVIVENNVRAFAKAELIYGNGRQSDNMLIIKWGPGVGSAVISNGNIYRGTCDASAEIGHTLIYRNGKKCRCGRTGCLETGISTHAIREEVPELKNLPVESWITIGEDKLLKIMHDRVEALAIAASNATILLDPGIVVVYGYMFDIPGIITLFKELFEKYYGRKGDNLIVMSNLVDRQYHIGSLAIAMNELFLKA